MKRDTIKLLHQKNGYRPRTLASGLKGAIDAFKAKRAARTGRREMLKLGKHLLDDLGFNASGRPLNPATAEAEPADVKPAVAQANPRHLGRDPESSYHPDSGFRRNDVCCGC